MAHYPADLLATFEHLSQMLDSAVSQDIPRIMGRLEELKVKLSLRLTAVQTQPSVADTVFEKERYLKWSQDIMSLRSGSIGIRKNSPTLNRHGRPSYFPKYVSAIGWKDKGAMTNEEHES